jgi:hypothetical protein
MSVRAILCNRSRDPEFNYDFAPIDLGAIGSTRGDGMSSQK